MPTPTDYNELFESLRQKGLKDGNKLAKEDFIKEISAIPTVLAFDILRLNEMTESMKRIREKFEEFAKNPNGPLSAVGKSMAEVLDRWEITTMEAGLHIFLSRENLKKIVRILLDPKTDAKQKESMTKFLQLILQIEEMGS